MAFKIVRNDITKIKADAIVNTANPGPTYMPGTDSAIYAAAGTEKLLEERKKIGPIEEGGVAVTPAFDLDAKYIFHTVGPIWEGGDKGEKDIVKKCYINCLNKAAELGIESIAFPLISTGVYGFPKSEALLTATSVFTNFLAENELDITLVVFDNESFTLSDKIFSGVDQFIDENYVEEKIIEEYSADACEEAFGAASFCAANALPVSEDLEERREVIDRNKRERRKGFFHTRGKMQAAEYREERLPMADACIAGASKPVAPRTLEDAVKNISDTWSESLLRMIDERGFKDTEVYKRANVDRKLFSKIRTDRNYQPKKATAVAFALALRLNLDETKDFIGRAGYAFSPSSKFDLIVQYFIDNEVYDFATINLALFNHEEPLLG